MRIGRRLDWGGVRAEVIAPPPGELFSETNGTACVVLDCVAEVGEGYTAIGPCTRP